MLKRRRTILKRRENTAYGRSAPPFLAEAPSRLVNHSAGDGLQRAIHSDGQRV